MPKHKGIMFKVLGEDIVQWRCPECKPIKENTFTESCWWCGRDFSEIINEINAIVAEVINPSVNGGKS